MIDGRRDIVAPSKSIKSRHALHQVQWNKLRVLPPSTLGCGKDWDIHNLRFRGSSAGHLEFLLRALAAPWRVSASCRQHVKHKDL